MAPVPPARFSDPYRFSLQIGDLMGIAQIPVPLTAGMRDHISMWRACCSVFRSPAVCSCHQNMLAARKRQQVFEDKQLHTELHTSVVKFGVKFRQIVGERGVVGAEGLEPPTKFL